MGIPVRNRGDWYRMVIALTVMGVVTAGNTHGQDKKDFSGEFSGMIGPLHVVLHVTVTADGSVSANVDSPDQRLYALPCTNVQINGPALTFTVPNVRGEWSGVLSADHTTLTGVWNQGAAIASVLRRGTGSAAPPANTAISSPAGVPTAAITPAAQASPCATMLGPTYWDGSEWRPMTAAAHLGSERGASLGEGMKALGRNPFNSRAGITNIVTFKGPEANLTLSPTPRFCIAIPPNIDPTVIMIGALEVKKDRRELETCSGPCASKGRNSDDWMPKKKSQPVDIKRLSDNAVEITPSGPLPSGQYIIGGPPMIGLYDFGVRASRDQ